MGLAKAIAKPKTYSIAEYLRLEEAAEFKSEYVDGQIVAMAGGTRRSSTISVNLISTLHTKLKGKPCRVFDSNLRVRVPRTPFYTYPDAHIICGPVAYDPDDRNETTVTNPRVIFEVLSPSTEVYDRSEKFDLYSRIPSFEEYVLVSQSKARVETYLKQKDGTWVRSVVEGLKASVVLKSIKLKLKLVDIYDEVAVE